MKDQNLNNLDGLINIYREIQKYLEARKKLKLRTHQEKSFFNTVNGNYFRFEHFFKRAVASSNQIFETIQEEAAANSVIGLGDHE